eukprot:scaffold91223_cov69-Phaeocystis_antarctica.AAC.3
MVVCVEEGAHIARSAVELVLGAIPGVEDTLGDRRAEHKGDEEVDLCCNYKRIATRVETAGAAAVEVGKGAQRNGDQQQSGREHAHQQPGAEAERDALAGNEGIYSRDEQLASRHELELSDARHKPFHLGDRLTQPLAVTPAAVGAETWKDDPAE